MPNYIKLCFAQRFTTMLVLLASLLVAPIITTGVGHFSPRPDCPLRSFELPQCLSQTQLGALMATGAVVPIKALFSENDKHDRDDALYEPRVPAYISCPFFLVFCLQLTVLCSISTIFPLRC